MTACRCRNPHPFGFEKLDAALGLQPRNVRAEVVDDDRAGALGVSRARVVAYRKRGLSEDQADRLAVHIGRHPGEVWPEWWALA